MRRLIFIVVVLCFHPCAFSQDVPQLQKLKDYTKTATIPGYDSLAKNIYLYHGNNINYLYPLYQLFRNENKFSRVLTEKHYYEQLSEYISFTEDYQSALRYAVRSYDTVSATVEKQILRTVEGLKNIQHADARKFISFLSKTNKVIMINEAHNKPLHRAFIISLLGDLYKKGFRYLAMETLNNYANHQLTRLNSLTGHYTCEPVGGELVRLALETGFKLVSYEDTLAYKHNASQRDSIQAENIYRVIKNDTAARIFVLAGYGHIAERSFDLSYRPMGMVFKKISGIDPLTIDQTDMTEESNFEYGRILYRDYIQKICNYYSFCCFTGQRACKYHQQYRLRSGHHTSSHTLQGWPAHMAYA